MSDHPEAIIYLGNSTWHNGPGWYYVVSDYPDEGACGAFASCDEAIAHAQDAGYLPIVSSRQRRVS